ESLGWIDVPQIRVNGTYELGSYDLNDGGIKALRIATGDEKNFYNLEYRSTDPGVLIHFIRDAEPDPWYADVQMPYLIDVTPATDPVLVNESIRDPFLLPGMSFSDPWTGFTISGIGKTLNGFQIQVAGLPDCSLPTPPPGCDTTPPQVTITSPAEGTIVTDQL